MSLVLAQIELSLPDRRLLGPLDLTVAPGTVTTLMGPSGCGKSSLLALIAGTLTPPFGWRGSIALNGRSVDRLPAEQRRIGLLFQEPMLFPHLSVGENVAFGLPQAIRGRQARQAAAASWLNEFGLSGFAGRSIASLSGGQAARVALARSLAAAPEAILLDEPFGRLDAQLRQQVRQFTFARIAAQAVPALLVTHDPDDAAATGGPVVALAG